MIIYALCCISCPEGNNINHENGCNAICRIPCLQRKMGFLHIGRHLQTSQDCYFKRLCCFALRISTQDFPWPSHLPLSKSVNIVVRQTTTTNTPANSEMHFLTLSQPRRKEPKLDNCAALFSKAYVRRSIAQVPDETAVGKHIRTGPRWNRGSHIVYLQGTWLKKQKWMHCIFKFHSV